MQISEIEIHEGDIDRAYRKLGSVKARVGAAHALSKTPTLEDVNFKLQEEALKMKGNAVINVRYERGVSMMSWKALTAYGDVVIVQSDEQECPFCAETIKRKAVVCRFCGRDLPNEDA